MSSIKNVQNVYFLLKEGSKPNLDALKHVLIIKVAIFLLCMVIEKKNIVKEIHSWSYSLS